MKKKKLTAKQLSERDKITEEILTEFLAEETMIEAIMRRSGLSVFDKEYVEWDVRAAVDALIKNNFRIVRI